MASEERTMETIGKVTAAIGDLTHILICSQESYDRVRDENDLLVETNLRLNDECAVMSNQLAEKTEQPNNNVAHKKHIEGLQEIVRENQSKIVNLVAEKDLQAERIKRFKKTNEDLVRVIANKVEAYKIQTSHDGLYIDSLIATLVKAGVDVPRRHTEEPTK